MTYLVSFIYANLFKFDFDTNNFAYVNHTQIPSWNQPVLSMGKNFLTQGHDEYPIFITYKFVMLKYQILLFSSLSCGKMWRSRNQFSLRLSGPSC